ncbi:MAG TPA: methyltransferase [Saprospiraceae bacterium]|nr:methyltransferase [Saprospiraceae bacterium]
MDPNQPNQPSPSTIMQIGTGFWASKVLLAAIHFELFTQLAERGAMSAPAIKSMLNFNCIDRHVYDFLDILTGFGFLKREGLLENAKYSNGTDTEVFLNKGLPSYIGGILEMLNNRLYRFWGDLENGLRTGQPQNEAKGGVEDPFKELYKTPEALSEFIQAMSGIQKGNFMTFARKFDFSPYKTLTDAGGAGANLCIAVAKEHPHMACTCFDLPAVNPIASLNIKLADLNDRVKSVSGNFFEDPIPSADIIVMGNILHDWDENKKMDLVQKAYDALPENGVFVAIENVIDEDRRQNIFGMMMSLNMLIETGKGFDYTFSDFKSWAEKAGFKRTELVPLAGPSSAAIAYK